MNLTSFILSAAILLQSVWTEKANADWKHPLLGKGLHCKCVMEKPVKKGLGYVAYRECLAAPTTYLFAEYESYEATSRASTRLSGGESRKGDYILGWHTVRKNEDYVTLNFYNSGVPYKSNPDFIVWDKFALNRETLAIHLKGYNQTFPTTNDEPPFQKCEVVTSFKELQKIQAIEAAEGRLAYKNKTKKNKL